MSKRSAEYAIQGFLYQFNLSLYTILSEEHDRVQVEGIVEDIDIYNGQDLNAIQCKYHEAASKFYLSSLYEPILKIMAGWQDNSLYQFTIYSYYPTCEPGTLEDISISDIEKILQTKSEKLKKLVDKISDDFDIEKFLKNFKVVYGYKLQDLECKVKEKLEEIFSDKVTVENVIYPNAISYIANRSILKDENSRFVERSSFIKTLEEKQNVVISRWTKLLKNYKDILASKRSSLSANLRKNVRRRCFYISQDSKCSFLDGIVLFIRDYIDKYHYKIAHTEPPIFCLCCENSVFQEVETRLYHKKISCNKGEIGGNVIAEEFYKPSMSQNRGKGEPKRDFHVRLLHADNVGTLSAEKMDDLFVVDTHLGDLGDYQDVEIEHLDISSFQELKYLLGINANYE